MLNNEKNNQTVFYLVIFVFFASLFYLLRLWERGLSIPFSFEGDSLHHLMIAKAFVENGWWWNNPQLSAPFTLSMKAFPVDGNLDLFFIFLFSRFTSSPIAIINLYFILSLILTFFSAYISFRFLNFEKLRSAVLGALFVYTPFIFIRSTTHLMLVSYLVPLTALTAILIASGEHEIFFTKKKSLFFKAIFFLLGLNYIYTTYFSSFFLVLAGVILKIRTKEKSQLKIVKELLLFAIAGTVVGLLPSVIEWIRDPALEKLINGGKSASEAENYGLKLRHLISPSTDHWLPLFSYIAKRFSSAGFPLESENVTSRLGLWGTTGFFYLLFTLIKGQSNSENRSLSPLRFLWPVTILVLFGFLFFSIGGFGTLFNIFISPAIRAYCRISIFISFFSLISFGILWMKLEKRLQLNPKKKLSLLVFIFAFSFSEQLGFANLNSLKNTTNEISSISDFVSSIENECSQRIYMLPFSEYPNTPFVESMHPHEHLKAYVFSKKTQWSWPTLSIIANKFNHDLEQKDLEDKIKILKENHFSGIWINTNGFKDRGIEISNQLEALLKTNKKTSRDQKYIYIPISKCI